MQVGHETTDASSGNNHFSQDNVMVMVMLRIWGSFWKKDSLITHTIFELCLFWYSAQSTYLWDTLYVGILSGRHSFLMVQWQIGTSKMNVVKLKPFAFLILEIRSFWCIAMHRWYGNALWEYKISLSQCLYSALTTLNWSFLPTKYVHHISALF